MHSGRRSRIRLSIRPAIRSTTWSPCRWHGFYNAGYRRISWIVCGDGQFLRDPAPARFELDLRLFQIWTRDLGAGRSEPGTAIRLELHARLQRLADVLPPQQPVGGHRRSSALLGAGGLSKVEQLAAYIAQHCQETILIGDAAREVGLHPNYAMNLFKRTFNLTLNEYITQHRMWHAQRLLATTDDKIVDIALTAGYPTLSRFYEAFRKSCGDSPSRYRREHRHADGVSG